MTDQPVTATLTPWGEWATLRYDEMGQPIEDWTECGGCGLRWNDALITSRTPAPSGRCPMEAERDHEPVALRSTPETRWPPMDVDAVRGLVGDLLDNMSSLSPGAEMFYVDTAWATELVAAVFGPVEMVDDETECAECGETYPASDGTWSDDLADDVCVRCAHDLDLLNEETQP